MIGAEVAARYTAKVGTVLSPLPLNQTFAFNVAGYQGDGPIALFAVRGLAGC